MNDSFLEDLDLIPKETKKTTSDQQVDRYVTTRHATSSPLLHFSEQNAKYNITPAQKQQPILSVPKIPDIRIVSAKDSSSRSSKKQSDHIVKKHSAKAKVPEKNEKIIESKVKFMDVQTKIDNKQQVENMESKIKLQETRLKVPESKMINRDRTRRSGSHKESSHSLDTSGKENRRSPDSSTNHSSDASSKENSRPFDSSKENSSQRLSREKEKLPDSSKRSSLKIQDKDPVILLTAIKELISTYTKQESTKILRVMQELHINSQATLLKNLLDQTDDLVKEMHPSKESAKMRALIEENDWLNHELINLRVQNQDLQKKLEQLEFLKVENAALKEKHSEQTQT